MKRQFRVVRSPYYHGYAYTIQMKSWYGRWSNVYDDEGNTTGVYDNLNDAINAINHALYSPKEVDKEKIVYEAKENLGVDYIKWPYQIVFIMLHLITIHFNPVGLVITIPMHLVYNVLLRMEKINQ